MNLRCIGFLLLGLACGSTDAAKRKEPWLTFDPSTLVARSNIVLATPNRAPTQFMPLGNGRLGAAVWAQNGLSAQLNRIDTFPNRKSPGVLTIPGLSALTDASDFRGTLDLYNAWLDLAGGGMAARVYVRADADVLVVEVKGADPTSTQTAAVSLWSPRSPAPLASGAVATLAESWLDDSTDKAWVGGSGQRFGSLAALTASGRNIQAATDGSHRVTVTFQPNPDGSFRVLCASPSYKGGDAAAAATTVLGDAAASSATIQGAHQAFWHGYWGRVGLLKMESSDGAADYVENLRTLYLYSATAHSRDALPGSQAGIADLFAFSQDTHQWFPAGYWYWNLRMQVAANMSAGAFELNDPLFNLYLSNLANIQAWTKQRMGGRAGICLPETMRFNGTGWYAYDNNQSCDETIPPTYNSLTLSSGAEVGLMVWQHYRMTSDRAFLAKHYPLMAEAARFLLAYATLGDDGFLHMLKSNAHETQWGVTDPITDIAAMRALFPAVIAGAQVLATDGALVADLQAALPKLPELPRTDFGRTKVMSSADDPGGTTILAYSTQPAAERHNDENLDLEPIWPYGLIGDDSKDTEVARRTYQKRSTIGRPDWSFDALQAARLGLGSEVSAGLLSAIGRYQVYPSGFAAWDTANVTEPYIEQIGVLASAVAEALAQEYDGVLRIAPAWPTAWNVTGTVFVQGQSKVQVSFQGGALGFAVLQAGATGSHTIRNPWPAQATTVVDDAGHTVVAPTTAGTFVLAVEPGHSYLIKRASDPTPKHKRIAGTPATTVRKLNGRTIGVP